VAEGMEAEPKRGKKKIFWYPAQIKNQTTRLGWMAQTPRNGTGGSVGQQ